MDQRLVEMIHMVNLRLDNYVEKWMSGRSNGADWEKTRPVQAVQSPPHRRSVDQSCFETILEAGMKKGPEAPVSLCCSLLAYLILAFLIKAG